jgi:hypothetical protein
MARIRIAAGVIRSVVRATPPPDLRDRTLRYVASLGRDRAAESATTETSTASREPGTLSALPVRSRRRLPVLAAAIAAVLVVAVAGTALVAGNQREAELAARNQTIGALEQVMTWSMRVSGEPDAEIVDLAATDGSSSGGRLLFSPSSRELVVMAHGLERPQAGREFRCWVEMDGRRYRVGRMFFADDLAFWVGPVEEVSRLPADATFGVTLVDAAGDSLDGPAVLSGAL